VSSNNVYYKLSRRSVLICSCSVQVIIKMNILSAGLEKGCHWGQRPNLQWPYSWNYF